MAEPDNTLLVKFMQDIHQELGQQRALLLQSVEYSRRLEKLLDSHALAMDHRMSGIDRRIASIDERITGIDRRIGGLKDDLELMIRSELMGALGNLETKIEHLLDERLPEKME